MNPLQLLADQGAEFFMFVDERYFSAVTGEWQDYRDYGNCTTVNSSPIRMIQRAGHHCQVKGITAENLLKYGDINIDTGHDWLVISNRWIFDVWAMFYADFIRCTFDLHNHEDRAFIRRRYGPGEHWDLTWTAEQLARPVVQQSMDIGDDDWNAFLKHVRATH